MPLSLKNLLLRYIDYTRYLLHAKGCLSCNFDDIQELESKLINVDVPVQRGGFTPLSYNGQNLFCRHTTHKQ